jgi:hypothetical protein
VSNLSEEEKAHLKKYGKLKKTGKFFGFQCIFTLEKKKKKKKHSADLFFFHVSWCEEGKKGKIGIISENANR